MANDLTVLGEKVRQDGQTGYFCITDIAALKGESMYYIANWLRLATTIDFIEKWEAKHNLSFKLAEFDKIKKGVGLNTYRLSATQLVEAGCRGIMVKRGRYGGTYAAIQWALHFANWLDGEFYLETLDSYLHAIQMVYGPEAARERFARELAAENYKLVQKATQLALPERADKMVKRHSIATEMDMINVAVFGMTARQWRQKVGIKNTRDNMRNHATPEELKVVAHLEHLNARYIEHTGDAETRLALLMDEARLLFEHFCDTEDKKEDLAYIREKRGW